MSARAFWSALGVERDDDEAHWRQYPTRPVPRLDEPDLTIPPELEAITQAIEAARERGWRAGYCAAIADMRAGKTDGA